MWNLFAFLQTFQLQGGTHVSDADRVCGGASIHYWFRFPQRIRHLTRRKMFPGYGQQSDDHCR